MLESEQYSIVHLPPLSRQGQTLSDCPSYAPHSLFCTSKLTPLLAHALDVAPTTSSHSQCPTSTTCRFSILLAYLFPSTGN